MPAPIAYVAVDMTSGSMPAMDIDWLWVVLPSTMWTRTSTAASTASTIEASPATSLRSATPTATHPSPQVPGRTTARQRPRDNPTTTTSLFDALEATNG